MKDPQPSAIDFSEALSRLKQSSDAFVIKWRLWAEDKAFSRKCERHAVTCPRDEEASCRTSWSSKEMIVVFDPCPKCVAEDVIRSRSQFLREAGVQDENVLHASFENFISRSEADAANLESAKSFVERRRGFLLMLGPVGTGKSHLSVAIMRATTMKARFITQSRLLRKLRATYRDERAEDPIKAFSAVGLLILDELGLSVGGRDELPLLHDILSARHEGRKPTVLTSNLTKEELAETIGERMADRLRQSAVAVLNFAGESMRTRFRKEYHEEKKP